MNRSVLLLLLSATALCVGCNLSDPLVGGPTNNSVSDPDADSEISDVTNVPDAGEPTPDSGERDDTSVPDGGADVGDMELPDMGTPLTAENFFARFGEALCDALIRIDYQPSDFYYWTTPAECITGFTQLQSPEVEFLAHDARQGRLGLDLARATEIIDYLEATDHPTDLNDLPLLSDAYIPLASPGDTCSSDTSCEDDADGSLPCFKSDSRACEGACVRPPTNCGGTYCSSTQYCDRGTGMCGELRPDGANCTSDAECQNHCVRLAAGGATCGVLLVDEDCSLNPSRCADGLFCHAGTLTCRPLAADGEACESDQACGETSVCDNGTCVALGEGTPCRFNSDCGDELTCTLIADDGTGARACYSVRATGSPCAGDDMCSNADFCTGQPTPVCTPRRQISEPCSYEDQCSEGLACRRADDGSTSCEPWQWGLGEGAVCFENAATCSFGLYCVRDTPGGERGSCQPRERPIVGEACEVYGECLDSICGPDGFCVALLADGETCGASAECASGACAGEPRVCVASLCPL